MRRILQVLVFLAMAVGLAGPVQAFDHNRADVPSGWGRERLVRHWVYYPRYHHVYHSSSVTDPYAYHYQPRGCYPYYNSAYWRPRAHVALKRAHFKHPRYYKAWGAHRKHYSHYRWHYRHHGGHDRAHW
jgi:hypothetical protein